MAYTDIQARAYYDTLTPEQKAQVDASGGPSVQWFTNAVGAGVPDAGRIAGGRAGAAEGGWEGDGGYTVDPSGAAGSSEWLGKRMPTAQEFRKWAQEQHSAYLGGNRGAQDEDYQRYTDRQIAAWVNEGWDALKGGWKQGFGAHGANSSGNTAPVGGTPPPPTPPPPTPPPPTPPPPADPLKDILMRRPDPGKRPDPGLGLPYGGSTGGQNFSAPTRPTVPVQGSLPNLLAPLNAPAQPQQGGLTNMLSPLQRNRRPNAWF